MSFDKAFAYTMKWEGGSKVTKDPDDPGGTTKYGISQRAHPSVDIENLTEEEAKAIYLNDYWIPLGCEYIGGVVAAKLFDAGVNVGTGRAAILAQQAYNDTIPANKVGLTPDGRIGHLSIGRLSMVDPERWLEAFEARLINHYNYLIAKNPKLSKYARGWTRRAESVPEDV